MIHEFFCGIGGMHYALERFLCDMISHSEETRQRLVDCILSYDINPHTNATYYHNFKKKVIQKDIRHVPLDGGMWLLSPPCQPFTRTGKKRDVQDERCQALVHLISQIPLHLPTLLFLENVVGFETSIAHQRLLDTLRTHGYQWKEYLVSPVQWGIPNDRPRYYLCAQREGYKEFLDEVVDRVGTRRTPCTTTVPLPWSSGCITEVPPPLHPKPLYEYLDLDTREAIAEHRDPIIPDLPLALYQSRYAFDPSSICHPDHTTSPCFTKAYGKHSVYSGGFLQTKRLQEPMDPWLSCPKEAVPALGLRLFRPQEIQRLQGFHDLVFPECMTEIQKYKMLGNSMSVDVVYYVMKDAWGHVGTQSE
jgi:tRNA (cytosine38-C5)-methyltransferase